MPLVIAFLLLLLPSSLLAQESIQPNTISVSGTASVKRAPDQAVLQLAVETFAATAKEAANENAAKMDAVMAALRKLGLGKDQLQTSGYSITPEYDYNASTPRQPGEDRLIGFRVRNMVQVTTDDVPQVGNIIDVATAAGANRVTNLAFQLRDPESARQEALRLAIGKARTEAETIAAALGRTLGPAIAASTTGAFAPPVMLEMRAMAARTADFSNAAPPIEPGLLEVSAQVSVIYSLSPAR